MNAKHARIGAWVAIITIGAATKLPADGNDPNRTSFDNAADVQHQRAIDPGEAVRLAERAVDLTKRAANLALDALAATCAAAGRFDYRSIEVRAASTEVRTSSLEMRIPSQEVRTGLVEVR